MTNTQTEHGPWPTLSKIHSYGWCCTDCTMLLANGEVPVDMNDAAIEEYLDDIARRTGHLEVVLGGEHDDDCPNMVDGHWSGHTDCYCEHQEFSWSSCDVCGSPLGGSRDAVTFFETEEETEQ